MGQLAQKGEREREGGGGGEDISTEEARGGKGHAACIHEASDGFRVRT